VHDGRLVHPAVAEALGIAHTPAEKVLKN
jgi:hypothetical protein